jgi:outer membrane receptor protein involved in Fe transport
MQRLAVLVLGLVAALPLRAQSSGGAIVGRVTDGATGEPVPGVTVLVRGTLLQGSSNSRGEYRVRGVPPGPHVVRSAAIGFESVVVPDVVVAAADSTRVDFALRKATVELPQVAVTASQGVEKPGDAPASEAVLSRQEIVRRNVLTADQALAFVPGVIFNNGDIDIRGSTGIAGGIGSRVLVMLDGHPVLSGDGEAVDFSEIPLLDIDRIEVVKGGYSALYGSSALGGVVNIITSPIGDQPETVVGLHYGYYDLPSRFKFTDRALRYEGLQLQRSQRFGDIGARVYVDRESNAGFREDNGSNRWLLRTRVDVNPEGAHPGSFYAIYKWETDGNFLGWADAAHPFQVPAAQANDHSVAGRLTLGASLIPLSAGSQHVEVNPYLDYNLDRDSFPSDTINPSKYHRSTRLGTRAQWAAILSSRHTAIVGTDVSGTAVVSDELSDHTLGDAGVFLQDEYALTRRLSAIGGLRYDWHDVPGAGSESSLSPKLGLVFRPTDRLSTRVSVGHGYRAPSVIEQFTTALEDGFRIYPNPSLRGETSWSGEVGATTSLTRWLWVDAALYQTDYWNLIGPSLTAGDTVRFRNLTQARIRGLDLATRASMIPNLVSAALNYTYIDSRDLKDVDLAIVGRPLPYRSRHNVTGSLDLWSGLCGVDVRYRSRVQQVLVYEGDPRGSITLVDLRLGYRAFGTLLQVKASNLFQEHYVDIQERVPGQPRTIYLSAVRRF